MPKFRRFELYGIRKIHEMTDIGVGVRRALTFLSHETNQGDESDICGGSHGMVQQDSTESDAVFVTENDRTPCIQTHPVVDRR